MKSNASKFIAASFLGLVFNSTVLVANNNNSLLLTNSESNATKSILRDSPTNYNQAIADNVLLRINCGGDSTSDNGMTFSTDNYFNGGRETSNDLGETITNAEIDIYTTERSAINNTNTNFGYEIPVTNGNYTVKLHFAEIYFTGQSGKGASGAGRRVFDVILEGNTVLMNTILMPM